jgi:hypothetical protein
MGVKQSIQLCRKTFLQHGGYIKWFNVASFKDKGRCLMRGGGMEGRKYASTYLGYVSRGFHSQRSTRCNRILSVLVCEIRMLGESNFAAACVMVSSLAGSASSNLSHADPNVPVRHRRPWSRPSQGRESRQKKRCARRYAPGVE